MSEYERKKVFVIHENDAGSVAYENRYVEWLEQQIKIRDDIIGLSPDGDRHADLVAEIESLKAQLSEANDAAHRLADELHRADQELIEMSRELRQ